MVDAIVVIDDATVKAKVKQTAIVTFECMRYVSMQNIWNVLAVMLHRAERIMQHYAKLY